MSAPDATYAADLVRRHDRERFVSALLAPAARREGLLVLYAFNVEVARVREAVREPLAGAIRLQWWREVVESVRPTGETVANPVAGPLRRLVEAGELPREPLLRLLTAREEELSGEGFADLPALEAHAAATGGALAEAALTALGAADPAGIAAARGVGTACAVVGMLRSLPHHLSTGWLTLPRSTLAEAGTSVEEVMAGRAERPRMAQATQSVAAQAAELLAEARSRRVDRAGLAAVLPAAQAEAGLRRLRAVGWDAFAATSGPVTTPVRLMLNAMLGRF